MFGKKKQKPQIDKEQLELIKNAQKRITQKKRFYYHAIFFAILAVCLYIFNVGLGFMDEFTFAGLHWSVVVILIWALLVFWHFVNVFVISKFMGKAWEQEQLEKLVLKQQVRIDKLKTQLKKEAPVIDNDLIWHLRDDLKRFKALTSGHHIIMGRKTFESFPKPLPNRTHVVITRQKDYKVPDGVVVVNSLKEAITVSQSDQQPYIIGGGEIYAQAMPIANKLELTRVHHDFEDADTFFPVVDTSQWKEVSNTFHKKDENHDYEFSFITYEKR